MGTVPSCFFQAIEHSQENASFGHVCLQHCVAFANVSLKKNQTNQLEAISKICHGATKTQGALSLAVCVCADTYLGFRCMSIYITVSVQIEGECVCVADVAQGSFNI